ncbi:hypothetical protein H9P43_000480 [Blastocladiella emersonii ATCC 22665]|nr:hypothetical protein H9P43_000480 [Blastocladiella emersonii ATCC 22665]
MTSTKDGYMWLGFYFVANLFLTLHNKYVMAIYKFSFPYTLTGIHSLCAFLGCLAAIGMGVFTPAKLSRSEHGTMVLFSLLYSINIAISNVSLNMVSVPVHQVVRATSPVFTIALGWVLLKKRYSRLIILAQLPIVFGVALATAGDYSFTQFGLAMTFLGTVLASLKGIVTNVVLVGPLKLHPLDLLYRMSALSFVQTLLYSRMAGEHERLGAYLSATMSPGIVASLAANGAIAFFLNYVSFTANKKTGALTICVAANVKQVLSVLIAISMFHLEISTVNGMGIVITLLGGALYSFIEVHQRSAAAAAASAASSGGGKAALLPTTAKESSTAHPHHHPLKGVSVEHSHAALDVMKSVKD